MVYLMLMAYKYSSRRSIKKLKRKSKRSFVITLAVAGFLIYATINWILPYFIGGIGIVKNVIEPPKKKITSDENSPLAPPVFSIPFEATNTAQIRIGGYGTPNSKVKIYVDDQNQTVEVSSDGSFTAENISLKLGTNNIYGKTIDEAGKESFPSKTIKLQYSYDKPNLAVTQPEDNKTIQGGDKKITISGKTDPNVKIFINNSQVIVSGDGSFSSEQPLNDGDNIFNIKAIDSASNTTDMQRRVVYNP